MEEEDIMLPCVSVPRFLYGDTTSGNGSLAGNGVWEKMKRFIVSFWIALLMIAAATTALAADAAGIIAEGDCGGYGADVRWSLSTDGTLTISGTGQMADYWSGDLPPWSVYRGQIRTVEIEAGISAIGYNAFVNCSAMTSVMIPEGVTSIGGSAFSGCSGLSSVTIPESVTSIGSHSFNGCSIQKVDYLGTIASWCAIPFESGGQPLASSPNGGQLYISGQLITDIVIPEGITSIGNYTFAGVKDLTSVIIPTGVTSIGDYAFTGCSGLTSVVIPEGVISIGSSAFSVCSSLTSVTIPDSVTSIGNYAFSGCSGLISVVIPEGVISIGERTFAGCSGLTSITIPNSATSIGNYAFEGCSIQRVDYLGTVASWCTIRFGFRGQPLASNYNGGQLYIGGQLITDIVLPEGITSIGNYTFAGVKNLTSVIIPTGVTSIGDYAFTGCSGLTGVAIPDGVTSIGGSAFFGCSGLTSVNIPAGVTSIEAYTFSGCSGLTNVNIPDGVTSIGGFAFSGCSGLVGVVIPAGVTSIGDQAFYDCQNLVSAEFLGDAPTVEFAVFGYAPATPGRFCIYYHSGTSGWTSPTWNDYPSACIDMGDDYSTLNADNRNQQNILFTLNKTGKTATVGYASIASYDKNTSGYTGAGNGIVVIPDTVTKDGVSYRVIGVEQRAFSGNLFVREVVLGANLSSIQPSAFSGCSNFTAFRLGTSTRYSVEDGVLYDYGKYQLYIYPAGKPDAAFRVPDSVTDIAREAFATAAKLQTVVVPDTVLSIGRGAFAGCNGLVSMTLPFIGSSREDSLPFSELFNGSTSVSGEPQTKNLREVVITEESLKGRDFSGNTGQPSYIWSIESITLPACPAEIPEGSFSGCRSLKNLYFTEGGAAMTDGVLVIPDHVTALRSEAFAQCCGITEVYLPAATTALNGWVQSTAFVGCDGLQRFVVAEDNPAYSSDKWGVLYNKDKSALLQYPADRKWPYYNVPDSVNNIWQFAFQSCGNLINLYIPLTTSMMSNVVYNCPSTSLCVYRGSPAAQYAAANNLSYWFLDNYTLQGIYIHTLPEETVFVMGQEDFSGLYVVGNYGGKELQMDTYTLTYDPYLAGPQMVTVSNGDKTAQFEITLLESGTERIDLGPLEVGEGQVAFGAVYAGGRMLLAQNAEVFNGHAYLIVPAWARDQMTEAKVFLLKAATFMPV